MFESLFTPSDVRFIYWCNCIVALLEAYGVNRGRLNVSCCFSLHLIKPTQSGRVDGADWTVAVLSIYPPSSARTWFVINLNAPQILCSTHTLHRQERHVSEWVFDWSSFAQFILYCTNLVWRLRTWITHKSPVYKPAQKRRTARVYAYSVTFVPLSHARAHTHSDQNKVPLPLVFTVG